MNDAITIELLLKRADGELACIGRKLIAGERITEAEGLALYHSSDLGLLGALACYVKQRFSGRHVYFNRNFHIEPTNICLHQCDFCSYRRPAGSDGAWEHTIEDMVDIARRHAYPGVTEVHITGGVHPDRNVYWYASLLHAIHTALPDIHIKAFSAVELDYMFTRAGLPDDEGFALLRMAGLQSIPGGGAEIFDESIRRKICPKKTSAQRWLDIHRSAHQAGILSNATMLYGHIEQYAHRIDHLTRLRNLQDETHGFNAFIPLKYRMANNRMSAAGELSSAEDMKNYAVSRLFLDNIPHIKAYWPMTGSDMAQVALSYGADDLDGTIDDTTKIYSMAGAADSNPSMSIAELTAMIRAAGYLPTERNSLYKAV